MITEKFTLKEILEYNFESGKILLEQKISFSHYLKFNLESICKKKSLDLNLVLKKLNELKKNPSFDFLNLSTKEMSEKIQNEFHDYSRKRLSVAEKNLQKLYDELKSIFPKLKNIFEAFEEFKEEFESHLLKEEQAIFPEIEKLEILYKENKDAKPKSLDFVIENMEREHLDHELLLIQILNDSSELKKILSDKIEAKNYSDELNLFYLNLGYHIYFENEVLFRKAKRLENSFYF